ncbi:MAG: penicillin-binding protein 1C [Bacteroidales bacterium]|nr:penicillin-binding protein 1C [Bacteroidales bacterium]
MSRRKAIALILLEVLLAGWLCCLPGDLFRGTPYATVVTDRNGELLGARIASDGQWRFPPCDTVPSRYATALVQFEDRHFRWHPGVDPLALARALRSNLREGHVVSGGSTITMQVVRMSRGKERTLWQKGVEAILATRLESRLSKDEILALYASHAPFGGNVVGLDAAAWRYFGRPADELSWAESATLAILPNAPSSIHPGKGRDRLLEKRNRLLRRLHERGFIDSNTLEGALEEPLPEAPYPLPNLARQYVAAQPPGVETRTGIDIDLQRQVEDATTRWSDELALGGIADLAAVILDIRTGETIAYVGNASPQRARTGSEVDIAAAPRSTGSILKPFLYCAALQDGTILPRTLLKDTPVNLNGFAPQNFDLQFHGAVPAAEALARSLNVPAVHLLRAYGAPRLLEVLREAGLTTLTRDASDYGLSLILGGGEGTLADVTRAYAGMVRRYEGLPTDSPFTDRIALWYTFEALKEVNRPDEIDWKLIRSVRKAAWKTGTSYGYRDAWAVGVTPDYAIGVWCGNADGHGIPLMTGARTAGPVLFDLLNLLPPSSDWFEDPLSFRAEPEGRSREISGVWLDVCTASGMLRSQDCPDYTRQLLPERAADSEVCPYHRDGSFRLPPAMEWYYKTYHPEYEVRASRDEAPLEFLYPESGSVLTLPRQLDGSLPGAVFQAVHRDPAAVLYWHLDNEYLGETHLIHQMQLSPPPGKHTVTVVDGDGKTVSVGFTVASTSRSGD